MARLIMMRGLPASGKSTKAQEIIENATAPIVRLNRDLLREMLHFDRWTRGNEKQTVHAQYTLAKSFLESGVSVIIDDTNITRKHEMKWLNLAVECEAKFEIITMDSTNLSELIRRDSARDRTVGEKVIRRMAAQKEF